MVTSFIEHNLSDNLQIVLVEPRVSQNVGMVARAMMNLGFRKLALVGANKFDISQAAITACWARPILDQIQFYDSLRDAISSCHRVCGFSARAGKNRVAPVSLADWAALTWDADSCKTALVFGPEDHGLLQEHLELCTELVCIPASSEYPAFNLAQAVLLTLYELTRTFQPKQIQKRKRASQSDLSQLDTLIDATMELSGFLDRGTPAAVPGLVRNLFRRLEPTQREAQILLGLFNRISGTLEGRLPVVGCAKKSRETL